jgi:hypothetical protein
MTETLSIAQIKQLKETAESKITDILSELQAAIPLNVEGVDFIRTEYDGHIGLFTTYTLRIRISL